MYKVEINTFKPSGKWAYGGIVELPVDIEFFSPLKVFEYIATHQNFMQKDTFRSRWLHTTLTTLAEYENDPECKFFPMMWPAMEQKS